MNLALRPCLAPQLLRRNKATDTHTRESCMEQIISRVSRSLDPFLPIASDSMVMLKTLLLSVCATLAERAWPLLL